MVCYFSTRNCGTLSWTYVTVSGADAYSGTSTRISVSRIVLYRREHNKSLLPRRNGEEQRFFLSLRRSKRHVDILWFNERTKFEMCLRMKLYERYIIYLQSSKYVYGDCARAEPFPRGSKSQSVFDKFRVTWFSYVQLWRAYIYHLFWSPKNARVYRNIGKMQLPKGKRLIYWFIA